MLLERLENLFHRINRRLLGIPGIMRLAFVRFAEARGPQAASSLSYFAFFSLFPLLLLVIAVAGFLFEDIEIVERTIRITNQIIPFHPDTIRQSIADIAEVRTPLGALGLLGGLWSSSGMFNVLIYNINLAWPNAIFRSALRRRLTALIMVITLILLLSLSLLTSTITEVLSIIDLPFAVEYELLFSGIWNTVLSTLPWIFAFLLFLALYSWVPSVKVRWKASLVSALAATIAWEAGKGLFALYLNSPFSRLNQVYGPLSTIAVLLLWIYLSGAITLYFAHVCAAIDQSQG